MPRDEVFSFIVRPGRKLTPACISEVEQAKIGADVCPATDDEVDQFMQIKLAQSADPTEAWADDPLASVNISRVLRVVQSEELNLLGDESVLLEFKSEIPREQSGVCKIVKTIVAFSNARGGYIFFGIGNSKAILGSVPEIFPQATSDQIAQLLHEYFSPEVRWEVRTISIAGERIPVLYLWESRKSPVFCRKDKKGSFSSGACYVRKKGFNSQLEPGDLPNLIRDKFARLERELEAKYFKALARQLGGRSVVGDETFFPATSQESFDFSS